MHQNQNLEFLETPQQNQRSLDFFDFSAEEGQAKSERLLLTPQNANHYPPNDALSERCQPLGPFYRDFGNVYGEPLSPDSLSSYGARNLSGNCSQNFDHSIYEVQSKRQKKQHIKKSRMEKKTQDRDEIIDGCEEVEHHDKQNSKKAEEQLLKCEKRLLRKRKCTEKMGKFIFKDKKFSGSEKISLPKKIGKLFANYISQYSSGDQEIDAYNNQLKINLKRTVKNDYTFEKTIAEFVGIIGDEGKQSYHPRWRKISSHFRQLMPQIIKKTMRQEVIMRQKISRNRQTYMMQLKVYCLRCHSHKLAQKGCFK